MPPVDWVGIVAVSGGLLLFLIPIAGFTARFALKPIAEAVAKMRGGGDAVMEHLAQVEARLGQLEQRLGDTEDELGRLAEVQDFQQKLIEPEAKDR